MTQQPPVDVPCDGGVCSIARGNPASVVGCDRRDKGRRRLDYCIMSAEVEDNNEDGMKTLDHSIILLLLLSS